MGDLQLNLFEDPEITLNASRAAFSPDRKHRYALWRTWDRSKSIVMFVGLNPSTADEVQNDPTVSRCIKYAEKWGFGGMIMSNIFAYRATDPGDMKAAADPVGSENDQWLLKLTDEASLIVAAWGNHAEHMDRGRAVMKLLENKKLHCLAINQTGHPKHPLYCSGSLAPIPVPQPSNQIIEIMNLRRDKPSGPFDVRVDRSSPLGNPFLMKTEAQRDPVCDQYNEWFRKMVIGKQNPAAVKEMDYLISILKEHGRLRLFCWCAPKRCHAEIIKRWLEEISVSWVD
jgi:hypothetical protein